MKKKSRSSAFFNQRSLVGLFLCTVGLLLALLAYTLYPGVSVLAQKPSQEMTQQPGWQVVASSYNDVSPPLRDMASWNFPSSGGEHEDNLNPGIPIHHIDRPDPVVQNKHLQLAANIPAPILNFDGIPETGAFYNSAPPDTDGYVGATQYVQIVNRAYQVFNKFTGASTGPMPIQSLWTGFTNACATSGGGDPIVLYDKLADRWLISQFATAFPGSFTDECIAISTTSDATGSYYRYDFHLGPGGIGSNSFDYPKLATWPDAYYMADNILDSAGAHYVGPQAFAFDRTKMLCGLPATFITPGITGGGLIVHEDPFLPSDLDGPVLPPPGAPNSFVEFPNSGGNNQGTYRTWHFHVDFATPTNSTFTQFAGPGAAGFTSLCVGNTPCVPQPTPGTNLVGFGDRLMFRLAYRNFGTPLAPNESLVGNYSVSSGPVAGVRWFELKNVTNGPVTVHQESTYQPDSTVWRWMGSAAMDHSGDFAIGYSASSTLIFPQIRYAGRLSTDPLNTLAQGEAHLYDGAGSQTTSSGRWGDYSAMTVDPVDDTTMWYTQEYYAVTSNLSWQTRIGAFRINPNQPLQNVSAKSRQIHGAAGPFDIDLPLYAGTAGPGRGVECRSVGGGIGGSDYTIVFNFTNSVTSVGGVTSNSICATATAAINNMDNHQVMVSLAAGACNGKYITLQVNNVSDGTNTISPSVTFGLLIGDTTGDGIVNASDVNQTNSQSGMACPPNFREDVNHDGTINASDVTLVQSHLGETLPTPP